MGFNPKIDFSSPEKFAQSVECIRAKHFSRKICEAKNHISSCSGPVIQSHSISRKFLKMIAREGHVYHFDDRLFGLIDRDGQAGVTKIGIAKASTYHMFCKKHDNDLFSPIEDEDLIPNEHQCLLLAYRTLMLEKYLKESQELYQNILVEQGISLLDGGVHATLHQGGKMALKDCEIINTNIVSDIKNNDLSRFRVLKIYFRRKPGFLCAGAFHVEFDYNGRQFLSLLSDQPLQDILSIHILPLSHNPYSNGVAILAWRNCNSHSDSQQFIESMRNIPSAQISNVLIHTVFEFLENVYMSPVWWESREIMVKNAILMLHSKHVHDPLNWKNINVQYDDWHFVKAEHWDGTQWVTFDFVS